jgi:hypothetical protein
MDWSGELEKLGGVALALGFGFGIAFLVLGAFQSSVQSQSALASNTIGQIIQAFSTAITNYLGLIITIIFLLVIYVIAKRSGLMGGKSK